MHEARVFRARFAHLRSILAIERASFGDDAYTAGMFRELFENCGDLFFVAKRSGRVAGYMVTCVARGRAEIVSIAVEPGRRKSGIGRVLMKHTLSALKKCRVRKLTLMVRLTNIDAIRFYRRFGFIRSRTVARYYEDGAAAWRMQRTVR